MGAFRSSMKKILIKGPALTRSGYGEQARFALRALASRPDLYDLYLMATGWGKTSWVIEDDAERTKLQCLDIDPENPLSTIDWQMFSNVINEIKGLGWV